MVAGGLSEEKSSNISKQIYQSNNILFWSIQTINVQV